MIELLVVADDLTGALDSGVQCARDGYRITVVPLDGLSSLSTEGLEVLVVDTESRHLEPAEAAERVRRAVASPAARGARVVYKKTDSTLRGNIGAELEAALAATGRTTIAYLPAFPESGRTAEGGLLLVNGRPVAETAFAADPLDPVRTSSIPELLGGQTGLPARLVALGEPTPQPLPEGAIVIFDGVTKADLERRVVELGGERERLLFAGCGGFAACLGRLMAPPAADPVALSGRSDRRLIVCGSLNPRSRRQLEHAAAMGIATYPLDAVETGTDRARFVGGSLVDELRTRLDGRGTVAITTPLPGRSPGPSGGLAVARRMGRVVAALKEAIGFDTLIVFGGDTLIAILRAIGCIGVVPLAEIEAGVPLSRALPASRTDEVGGDVRAQEGPLVVSKAGGFGSDRVLEQIERFLDRLAPVDPAEPEAPGGAADAGRATR